MNLQHLKDVARAEARKLGLWIKVALLGALPYARDIQQGLAERLPELQPYLPENIYKTMGGAVVAAGIVLSLWRSHQLLKAAQ